MKQLEANIAHYETRVAEQRSELEKMQTSSAADLAEEAEPSLSAAPVSAAVVEAEDANGITGDIEQLEQRKKALEDRVTGMDRDLDALAR